MKDFLVNAWREIYRHDAGKPPDYCFTVPAASAWEAESKGLEKISNYYGFKGKIELIEAFPAVSLID
jgi:hypothetical protein